MIEGDKTTTANLFLTNIFFSPKHFAICLTSEFALLQQQFMNCNKKRSYEDGHLHCNAAFFRSIEWQQWQGKLQGLTTTWRWDRIQRSQYESSWFRFWSLSIAYSVKNICSVLLSRWKKMSSTLNFHLLYGPLIFEIRQSLYNVTFK